MHWSENKFWLEATDRYQQARKNGLKKITIDLDEVEKIAYDGDGPAYSLMDAMRSVIEYEGMDGYRGAPRIMLALLFHVSELGDRRNDV